MVPLRFITTRSPVAVLTVFRLWKRTVPESLLSSCVCSVPRVAVPPMWNVRMVSCVPGSPMDWAARTPTASPSSTKRPVARFRP